MRHSVLKIARAVRRRLKRIVQKSKEREYGRQAEAILALWETRRPPAFSSSWH